MTQLLNFDIYDFFNSRDIAEHCRNIAHTFTAVETAYLVWHSNHHTLAQKHAAWKEIIDSLPDETFHPDWAFEGHTLHSFLQTYMRLQNEFIEDFRKDKDGWIFSYGILYQHSDQYCEDHRFFACYEACLETMQAEDLDDNPHNEILKAKITRHKVRSTKVSLGKVPMAESVVVDSRLNVLDVEPDFEQDDERRFLGPSYGFYEMWVAIPTPFRKGDIVMDVNAYVDGSKRHLPFILDRIPYWRKDAVNGDDCEKEVEWLRDWGADWTDMQECMYFQDDNGELYWDHAFHYLNLEYYREDLQGAERLLKAVSSAIQGKISAEELLRSHRLILMESRASELRKGFGSDGALMELCGIGGMLQNAAIQM